MTAKINRTAPFMGAPDVTLADLAANPSVRKELEDFIRFARAGKNAPSDYVLTLRTDREPIK